MAALHDASPVTEPVAHHLGGRHSQQGWGPPPQQGWGPPQGYPPQQWGPPQSPPPRKPRFGLGARIGFIVLGVLFIGTLGRGCAPENTTVTDAASPQVSSSQPVPLTSDPNAQGPATAQPPAFSGARPGDLATNPGGTLTTETLAITATELVEGDDTFGEALCATVTYLNRAQDRTVRYGLFDWSMQNPNGAIVNITFFGGADSQLQSGELAPGGTVTGDLCFEDENATPGPYVLLYESPSFFTDQRLAWINPR